MDETYTNQETVLIVDDNPLNLQVLFDIITSAGYHILIAQDGESAISHAIKAKPDIILLDIMMPGINGYETCKRLKENSITKDIPIIFVTVLSQVEEKVTGFDVGAVDYITKPFQHEEVIARIHTHLTIQRQKKELKDLAEKLSDANAKKSRLFSIIAHDMRNAFTPLFSSCNALLNAFEKPDFEKAKKSTDMMQKGIKKSYKLLENLLGWSRVQIGGMEYDFKAIDIRRIVIENIYLFYENAKQKEISLSHTLNDKLFVYADYNMIDTVLRNLIANAVKFTHAGGQVIVSAEIVEDRVLVSVKDTGIGMDKTTFDNLFQIDVKTQRSGTAGENGTGLGLILCKEFIEKNNGKLWAVTTENEGSTFFFSLSYVPESKVTPKSKL